MESRAIVVEPLGQAQGRLQTASCAERLALTFVIDECEKNQNINGWGLQVVDYFTPFNQASLNATDLDLGSAAPMWLPDEAGSVAHPHLLVASGKEGRIYLLDRGNLGKYTLDQASELTHVLTELPTALHGLLDTAAYFNQQIYYVQGYGGVAKSFSIPNGSAQLSATPTSVFVDSFAYAGSTPSVSANGTNNGIVWNIDRGTNQLRDSDNSSDEAHDSFALLQEPTNAAAVWQISVPHGTYQVTLLAGDPPAIDSVVALNAEGVLALSGMTTAENHWLQSTVTVIFADGRLTIGSAPGAIHNLIDLIEVLPILP